MIAAILYVLGVFAILLFLDFGHRRRADRWQQVVPRQLAGDSPTAHSDKDKQSTSTELCNDGAWNQRKAA